MRHVGPVLPRNAVIDPTSFKHAGIFPLGHALDGIWAMLAVLAADVCGPAHWQRFRRDLDTRPGGALSNHYGRKSKDRTQWKPCGFLVREAVLCPP